MGVSGLEQLSPEVFHLIAEQCPRYGDGFRLWCKLAAAFPRLCVHLPRATLIELARQKLPFEGDQRSIFFDIAKIRVLTA